MLRKFATKALVLCTLLATAQFANAEAVAWRTDVGQARQEASQSGKLLLLHFYTDACGPCKALDKNVFNQQTVSSALETNFIPVKINAFHAQDLVKAYGLTRVPTDVITTPNGDVVKVMVSPKTPMGYIGTMAEIASDHRAKSNQFAQAAAKAPAPAYVAQGSTKVPQATLAPSLSTPPTVQAPVSQPTVTPETTTPKPVVINNPAISAAPTVQPSQPTQAAIKNPIVGDRYAMVPTTPTVVQPTVTQQPVTQPVASQPAVSQPPQVQTMPVQAAVVQPTAPVTQPTGTEQAAVTPQAVIAQAPVAQPAPSQAAPATPATTAKAPIEQPVTPITPIVEPTEEITVAVDSERIKEIKAKLPAGSPALGFEGYCPVSMKEKWQWIDGDTRWGAIHEGRTYLFANEAKRDQFLASPEEFSPVLAGIDPVIAVERNQSVPGKREFAVDYEGKFYFFSSEQTLNKFWTNAAAYAKGTERVAAALKTTGTQLR